MYLSKLRIDLRNSSARQALTCCQDMHVNLMEAFDGVSRKDINLLYKIKDFKSNIYIYVQSKEKPDWVMILNKGYVLEGMVDITQFIKDFDNGRVYVFDLDCMPYKKVDGSRILLRAVDKRENWLYRKGVQYGFDLLEYREDSKVKNMQGIRRDKTKGFHYVNVKGILRINDVEKFKKFYEGGIGPEKAYGLGLMLLVRRT